jgi:hypothetical protein
MIARRDFSHNAEPMWEDAPNVMTRPAYDPRFVEALLASHAALLGESLVPAHIAAGDACAWLYEAAPFAVLAHDTLADPHFVYANLHAQRCFERPWDELVGMPSRLSAEAPDRAERAAALAQVAERGFTRAYHGVRVARSGRRFRIEDCALWNVRDPNGVRIGQAATFRRTTPLGDPAER